MINEQRKSIIKLKEKGKRQAMKKKWTEPGGHNRGPLEQSYYCGSVSFKGFWCWLRCIL